MSHADKITDIDKLVKTRMDTYGHHKAQYDRVWNMWEGLIEDEQFLELEGWRKVEILMILLKIGRAVDSPEHKDHWDDIAGYAELARGQI